MSVTTAKFTLEQYERMVELGAFDHPYKMRVELLNGEIVEMPPVGSEHAYVVTLLTRWSYHVADVRRVLISSQNPIAFAVSDSAPEPDIIWATNKNYAKRHPTPSDVLLLIEVAKSSLEADRGDKLRAYAEAGIGDYWLVNLVDRQVEVYRDPHGHGYRSSAVHAIGDPGPAPLAAPGAELDVASLFEAT